MDISNRLSMYKEMYYCELERKHKIHSDASLLVIILMPIVAAFNFFFYRLTIFLSTSCILQCMYLLALIGLCFSLATAVLWVIKALYKYPYGYIPKAEKIEKCYVDLATTYNKQTKKIQTEFNQFLLERYCQCADINVENNDRKLEYLRQAKKFIIVSFVFVTICSFLNALPHFAAFFK